MALFKNGFITGEQPISIYIITALLGTGIGLYLNYIDLSALYRLGFDRVKFTEESKFGFYEIRRVFQTLGYLSILILLYKWIVGRKLMGILLKSYFRTFSQSI